MNRRPGSNTAVALATLVVALFGVAVSKPPSESPPSWNELPESDRRHSKIDEYRTCEPIFIFEDLDKEEWDKILDSWKRAWNIEVPDYPTPYQIPEGQVI